MRHTIANETLAIEMQEDILSTVVRDLQASMKTMLLQPGFRKVSLNIKKTQLIDSEGINLIYGLYAECHKRQWAFKVEGANPAVKRLLSLLKLNQPFGVTE